jgi:drug/metabolite transporter (DMT)-like permease
VAADIEILMSPSKHHPQLGLLLVLAAVVAWSTAGLFTRILDVDIQNILFWRGLFGALGLLLIVLYLPATGGAKAFKTMGWPGYGYATITAISMLFFVSALKHTSVAHVGVITAVVPFAAAYLGWLFLKEAPTKSAVVASVVALLGVAMMVGISRDGTIFGDSLAVIMALGMAVMILISRKYNTIPALQATCVASAISAIAVVPFLNFENITQHDLAILGVFGIVNQVIGFGLFALGARWLPPTQTALLTALEAPMAPFWVWLFMAEVPSIFTIAGGMMVLIGVIGHILWEGRK